jgi:hypothetical protein
VLALQVQMHEFKYDKCWPEARNEWRRGRAAPAWLCLPGIPSVLQAASARSVTARKLAGLCSERNLAPFVSGFSGGRVKQHPIANPNSHSGEAFGVRTTWGWVQ